MLSCNNVCLIAWAKVYVLPVPNGPKKTEIIIILFNYLKIDKLCKPIIRIGGKLIFVGVVIAITASFCLTLSFLSIISIHGCLGLQGIIGSKKVSGKIILKSAI